MWGIKEVLLKLYTPSDPLLGCVYEVIFNDSKVQIRCAKIHPEEVRRRSRRCAHTPPPHRKAHKKVMVSDRTGHAQVGSVIWLCLATAPSPPKSDSGFKTRPNVRKHTDALEVIPWNSMDKFCVVKVIEECQWPNLQAQRSGGENSRYQGRTASLDAGCWLAFNFNPDNISFSHPFP